ncbi:glycogen accumulation regulator GarA [bacterium BMS3Abin02]|nr:glycogen accumulation regulator GarA [bacterium BMS3Abin02]GBE23720.1 glycogen accumulation regulator GarA [bacterium BMS3Bbin01]HDH25946.1 FHA domain-containing protein [Actinomycetota bacterium]
MHCPSCHAEIPNDAAQCPVCGISIEHEPTITFVPEMAASVSEAEEATLSGGYILLVKRGPRAGMGWVLQQGTTTVGRHPDSAIFLDDITVSRHHCRLILDRTDLTVEDSGSTNGTYVNGERVDRAALETGDELIVGKFHLVVAKGNE